jgi:hypothetical protein
LLADPSDRRRILEGVKLSRRIRRTAAIVFHCVEGSVWKVVTSTTSSNMQPAAFSTAARLSKASWDLLFEVRLGRSVLAAADLARDEEKVARADRR